MIEIGRLAFYYICSIFVTTSTIVDGLPSSGSSSNIQPGAGDVTAYCARDTVRMRCSASDVIVVGVARYGRMALGGPCKLQADFGFGRCSVNVVTEVDRRCSGRQECSFTVFAELGHLRPCSELETYLELNYTCVPISKVPVQCGRQSSNTSPDLDLVTPPTGYLSSYDPYDARDSAQCVYVLQAEPGQRWNITLLDFGLPASNTDDGDGGLSNNNNKNNNKNNIPTDTTAENNDFRLGLSNICRKYATISEEGRSSNYVCGGLKRERSAYYSLGHRILINIHRNTINSNSASNEGGRGLLETPRFLLHFEAVGCQQPRLPSGLHLVSISGTMATVMCNVTGTVWALDCHDNAWANPDPPLRCPANVERANGDDFSSMTSPWINAKGLAVVVSMGVMLGIIFGMLLLGLVAMCIRLKRSCNTSRSSATYMSADLDPRMVHQQQQQQHQHEYQSAKVMYDYTPFTFPPPAPPPHINRHHLTMTSSCSAGHVTMPDNDVMGDEDGTSSLYRRIMPQQQQQPLFHHVIPNYCSSQSDHEH